MLAFTRDKKTWKLALQDLEDKLKKELVEAVDRCMQDVKSFIGPFERHSEAVVAQIQKLQERERKLMEELSGIQQQAANVE